MPERAQPPLFTSRHTGLLYLLLIAGGLTAEFFVRQSLLVPGDPSATAEALLAAPGLFRLGLGADLVMLLCDTALAIAFYQLLRPVHSGLALLAAAFRLVHAAVLAANLMHHAAPLQILLEGAALGNSLETLAYLRLSEHATGYLLAQVFFGVHCLLLGRLLSHGTLVRPLFGWLLLAGGAGYLLESAQRLLLPGFESFSAPGVALAGISEILLAFALLLRKADPSP